MLGGRSALRASGNATVSVKPGTWNRAFGNIPPEVNLIKRPIVLGVATLFATVVLAQGIATKAVRGSVVLEAPEGIKAQLHVAAMKVESGESSRVLGKLLFKWESRSPRAAAEVIVREVREGIPGATLETEGDTATFAAPAKQRYRGPEGRWILREGSVRVVVSDLKKGPRGEGKDHVSLTFTPAGEGAPQTFEADVARGDLKVMVRQSGA